MRLHQNGCLYCGTHPFEEPGLRGPCNRCWNSGIPEKYRRWRLRQFWYLKRWAKFKRWVRRTW